MSENNYKQLISYVEPKTGLEIEKVKIRKSEGKLKRHNIFKNLTEMAFLGG